MAESLNSLVVGREAFFEVVETILKDADRAPSGLTDQNYVYRVALAGGGLLDEEVDERAEWLLDVLRSFQGLRICPSFVPPFRVVNAFLSTDGLLTKGQQAGLTQLLELIESRGHPLLHYANVFSDEAVVDDLGEPLNCVAADAVANLLFFAGRSDSASRLLSSHALTEH